MQFWKSKSTHRCSNMVYMNDPLFPHPPSPLNFFSSLISPHFLSYTSCSSRKRKPFVVPHGCHAIPHLCVFAQAVSSPRNTCHCSISLVTSYSSLEFCSHWINYPSSMPSVHTSIIASILFYYTYLLCFYPPLHKGRDCIFLSSVGE